MICKDIFYSLEGIDSPLFITKNVITVSIIIFFLLCPILCISKTFPNSWNVKVKWIIDGDTFILKNNDIVRLKGIDAPEIAHEKGEKNQYYAIEAKNRLIELIYNKFVIISKYGLKRDRFNRLLSYVYLPNGKFVNLIMIKQGYAFFFPHKDLEGKISRKFLAAQRTAMAQRRGFWNYILSRRFAFKAYIGNKRTHRFHTLTCILGKKIYWKNKIRFFSLYEAFYKGFSPCRKCTPWPYISK